MATAAPELGLARLWPAALLWVAVGGWALDRLPPDGSAGVLLGGMWAALLLLGWLPWSLKGWLLPRIAGLCCPAPQPRLSDVAMGWMMGTLWWHAEGCLGGALPATGTVALHLVGMLGLAQLSARFSPAWRHALAWMAYTLIAVWLLWTPGHAEGLWLCMALLTMAWACEHAGGVPGSLPVHRAFMLVCGPLGLWFIHVRWPVLGSDALLQPVALLVMVALALRLFAVPWRMVRILDSGGTA